MNQRSENWTKEALEKLANQVYPGIVMYARDINLPENLARKYTPGLIIREKAFTDASSRFMGMVTTHRYVILSNHMADLSRFTAEKGWGLHAANKDAHFMVLGRHTHRGRTGIFLLHLPDDENWKVWKKTQFSMDQQLYQMAVERFVAKCTQPPVPELTTREWLDRCSFPVGMSDDGVLWPLEDGAAPQPVRPDIVMRDRYRGCLLGGAVGDAMGWPIEFMKDEYAIRARYGPQGIRTLEQAGSPAGITDDTQMTLFAASAIVYAKRTKKDLPQALLTAYGEWLATQGDMCRMKDPENPQMWIYRDRRLHARRGPGLTCMNAIRYSPNGGTMDRPVNNSKGCGTVMRAAPFGLSVSHQDGFGDGGIAVHKIAATDAALTHGHVLAWTASSLLAQLIYYIVQAQPDHSYRLEEAIPHIAYPGDTNAHRLLDRAVKLALSPDVTDLDGIHALGEGWVAEEALAIAVFCAVRYQNDFAAAIRAAVNHKGDSDSTGAICGNILGAWLGAKEVEKAFHLQYLELRDVIEKVADELYEAVETTAPSGTEEHERPALAPLRPVGLHYTPMTKMAMAICFAAHKNQVDKGGMPYVFHPIHVAEQLETEEEVCTALLHDVVEDTWFTLEDLAAAGFPEGVLDALKLLTHDPREGYLDYVVRVRRNPIARRVKLADLAHNSDLNRLDTVGEKEKRRVLKYRMAQTILQDEKFDASMGCFRKRIPLSLEKPIFLSVFYSREGAVQKYSFDIEEAADSHYEIGPQEGEKLRRALDGGSTLPEALADWAAAKYASFLSVETLLRQGNIQYKPFHFD